MAHGRAVAVLPGWPCPRRPCHIRAIRSGELRSVAVAAGHSRAAYLDHRSRTSADELGNRSSKLVMRFRLPSPALIVSMLVSVVTGRTAAGLPVATFPAVPVARHVRGAALPASTAVII